METKHIQRNNREWMLVGIAIASKAARKAILEEIDPETIGRRPVREILVALSQNDEERVRDILFGIGLEFDESGKILPAVIRSIRDSYLDWLEEEHARIAPPNRCILKPLQKET